MLDSLLRRVLSKRQGKCTDLPAGKDRPARALREPDGATLAFRPDLVDELTHEHRLLESHLRRWPQRTGGDVERASSGCARSRTCCARTAEGKPAAYRYPRHALAGTPETAARTEALRREMQDIGRP